MSRWEDSPGMKLEDERLSLASTTGVSDSKYGFQRIGSDSDDHPTRKARFRGPGHHPW